MSSKRFKWRVVNVLILRGISKNGLKWLTESGQRSVMRTPGACNGMTGKSWRERCGKGSLMPEKLIRINAIMLALLRKYDIIIASILFWTYHDSSMPEHERRGWKNDGFP